jgi:hypothetical protein
VYAEWQLRAMEALGAEAARRFRPFVKADDVCLDFGCGATGLLNASRLVTLNVIRRAIPAQAAPNAWLTPSPDAMKERSLSLPELKRPVIGTIGQNQG